MCAIMGVLEGHKSVDLNVLNKMGDTLYHRGPDDSGVATFTFSDGEKHLNGGVRFDRLSIRDLSKNGHQPMLTEDGNIFIAFNGEIYNTSDLRPLLEDKGYKFRSNSDTEVILYLYESFGIDKTVELLDGMFAICLVNMKEQRMFLVKDRIGEKPLYVYQNEDVFMFASEYKAFYCHPQFKAELDDESVDEYFMFRYVAGNKIFLKGVENLEPGSYLEIKTDGIKKHKYWDIPDSKPNGLTFEENKENVRNLIEKSTVRRLIADVPVGIQLSGGVDSSYLASVVGKLVEEPLHTFGITFANEKFSEEKWIDVVNDKFGFEPHKYEFQPKDFIDYWKKSIWYFEAPQNHEGTMAMCHLNKEAKKQVTVMLCGDGPDELMGGYDRMKRIYGFMPGKQSWYGLKNLALRYSKFYHHRNHVESTDDLYISLSQWIKDDCFVQLRPKAGRKAIKKVYNRRKAILNETAGKGMRKYMNYEAKTYMLDILMRTDKIAMASSLEVRPPYLMPELIEYITTIPDDQLVSNTKSKQILKSLCEDVYGMEFTYHHKMGLTYPFLDYYTSDEVSDYVEKRLMPKIKERGVVDYAYVRSLWDQRFDWKTKGKYDWQWLNALWCVFSFEIWAQMYLDSAPIEFQESMKML